jgi:alkylation response protein AidB-like acyl-CoA dehydrogenase
VDLTDATSGGLEDARRVSSPSPQLPAPPERDLTPGEMIGRAVALRPQLVAEQAATEARRFFSPELHEAFLAAGFYHLYVPRRYGGYEFDVPTFVRVVKEVARGCVSTGWCLGLSMNHALQVGSWWPAAAQDAIFAGGDFRAGSVAAPVGTARRTEEGWCIDGQVAFASGSPYATFYVGQVLEQQPDGPPKLLAFVAPRSQWEMLDDWGRLVGLKGSGSHSLRFDDCRIPADWAIEGNMVDIDVSGGTPGSELHGNPMYAGRGMAIFTMSLAAVMVGGLYNALDEYERIMREKRTPTPPFIPRIQDTVNYQPWYGRARTRAAMLEAALHDCAAQHMELCRRTVEDGVAETYAEDMLLGGIAREIMIGAWDVLQADLWQTVGASAAGDDARITRVFRDMALAIAHRNPQQRGYLYGEIGRGALGEPTFGLG